MASSILKKITILFNKYGEQPLTGEMTQADRDTLESAMEINNVLSRCGYQVELYEVGTNEVEKISKIKTDLIFNMIEWTGQDIESAMRAMELLEQMKIPYTGSDKFGYELSTDKRIMKTMMEKYNISTPKWQIFETGEESFRADFKYPLISKPVSEHCGIGIDQDSVVNSEKKARERIQNLIHRFNQPAVVEEYIEGRELNVTIFEKNGKPWVLPPAEIIFDNTAGDLMPMFTFKAKWDDATLEFKRIKVAKAVLSDDLNKRIAKIAQKAYKYLGGIDYPRLDLRIRGEEIFVLEINNNPEVDFTAQGGIRIGTEAAGLSYEEAVNHIVKNAYARGVRRNRYAATTALPN